MDVMGIGVAVRDVAVRLSEFPETNRKYRTEELHEVGGGPVPTALVTLSRFGRSTGLVIDNVLIYRTQQTTLGLDSRSMSIDRPALVRRVTLLDVGASVGIKGGGIDSVYEFNNISNFGGLQYDGAALQMGGREHVVYRYNWSHDHPKRSFRFDAASYPDYSNAYGEIRPPGLQFTRREYVLGRNECPPEFRAVLSGVGYRRM